MRFPRIESFSNLNKNNLIFVILFVSSPEEVEDDEGGDKFIEITVSEPTRIGEGMSR